MIFHCAVQLERQAQDNAETANRMIGLAKWMKDDLQSAIKSVESTKEAWLLRSFLPANYSVYKFPAWAKLEQPKQFPNQHTEKDNRIEMESNMEQVLDDLLPQILQYFAKTLGVKNKEHASVVTEIFLALSPSSLDLNGRGRVGEGDGKPTRCQEYPREPQVVQAIGSVRQRALR